MLHTILSLMTVTAIIPESHALMEELGNPAASGWLIGSAWLMSGAFALMARFFMEPWKQQRIRALTLLITGGTTVCTILYAVAANPSSRLGLSSLTRTVLLFVARLGLGSIGMQTMFLRMMAQKVSPCRELVSYNFYRGICSPVGVGLGPLVSSLSCNAMGAMGVRERAAAPLCFLALFWVMLFAFFSFALPRDIAAELHEKRIIDEEESEGAVTNLTTASDGHLDTIHSSKVSLIWTACAVYGIIRAIMVSSLESATAFVLQLEFLWDTSRIGFAIGSVFLTGVPIAVACVQVRSFLPDSLLVCISSAVCAVATVVIFEDVGAILGSGAQLLLIADLGIFAALYLGSSLLDGVAAVVAAPGKFYSQENYLLINQLLQNSAARFLGPPAARFLILHHGRNAYACFQFILALFSVTCAVVVSLLSTRRGSSSQP
mmetsp:Transcript_30207/g.68068  ORF Transcript_30207/g.68068 Transcript_30207/m.68068 type:complete len:433 (-) Transcript_30207:38-1336(-)